MHHHPWTPSKTLTPLFSTALAIFYALHILTNPPRHPTLAFLALSLPTTLAFATHPRLTPWFTINDTFGRFLYIWLAHMSHVLLILPRPPSSGTEPWGARVRGAWKVLFARHPPGARVKMGRRPGHSLSRMWFCVHHVKQAALMLALLCIWDTYLDVPTSSSPTPQSLIRRLPASLNAAELYLRLSMTISVCVADMLYFDALHSLFALLCVCILHLDAPKEWSLSLFGSLADAWSVRRFWGIYWHDYVAVSFSAHARVLTRRGLGMRDGGVRRVLENAVVFVVSGAAHAVVRWVQTEGSGEVWCVAFWYAGQVLALVVEGTVQGLWVGSVGRRWLGGKVGRDMLGSMERGVGYVWVFCWMFWSVPKYILTRNEWEMENWRKRYPDTFAGYDASGRVGLGE